MLLIGNTMVDPKIATRSFVCHLEKCKGACCVSGKQGAPLEIEEVEFLKENQEVLLPFLTPEGRKALEQQGTSVSPVRGKFYTPLITGKNSKACAYICYDEKGITQCAIEVAFHQQKISFQKPISCHLYPLRRQKKTPWEFLYYEDWEICASACELGKQLSIPLYQFLQKPLIRCYGKDWYEKLIEILKTMSITKASS